jgi:hypothetical protein
MTILTLEGFAAVLFIYMGSANGITPAATLIPFESYDLCLAAKADVDKTTAVKYRGVETVCTRIRSR